MMSKKLIGKILGKISDKIFGAMNDESEETYLSVEEEPHLSEEVGSPYYVVITRNPSMSYGVLIGISEAKGAETQLVGKLLKFARLHETKIDFGWPEALTVAQATDASVLANRISFAQESVRTKQ